MSPSGSRFAALLAPDALLDVAFACADVALFPPARAALFWLLVRLSIVFVVCPAMVCT